MERGSTKRALRQIRTLYELGTLGGLSDGQLLELFLTRSGADAEDAFAMLVHRHGPMVLGVCRRMLRSSHDAEDAFQATCASFLQSHLTARGATPEAIAIETGQIAWPGECLIVPVISRLCNRRLHDADLKGFQKTSKP
jgi:hypothetical protein